jgi:hypothetical protein
MDTRAIERNQEAQGESVQRLSLSSHARSALSPCRELFLNRCIRAKRLPNQLRNPTQVAHVPLTHAAAFLLACLSSASRRFTQTVWAAFQRNAGHDATSFGHVSCPCGEAVVAAPRFSTGWTMWGGGLTNPPSVRVQLKVLDAKPGRVWAEMDVQRHQSTFTPLRVLSSCFASPKELLDLPPSLAANEHTDRNLLSSVNRLQVGIWHASRTDKGLTEDAKQAMLTLPSSQLSPLRRDCTEG